MPVAAYPVPGPLDILGPRGRGIHGGKHVIGALDEDLGRAVTRALKADRIAAAQEALHYSWEACTLRFIEGIVIEGPESSRLAA